MSNPKYLAFLYSILLITVQYIYPFFVCFFFLFFWTMWSSFVHDALFKSVVAILCAQRNPALSQKFPNLTDCAQRAVAEEWHLHSS